MNRMDIEDLIAEAEFRYLKLGRKLENPSGWKRIVIRNLIIDKARKKKNYREVPLVSVESLAEDEDSDGGAEMDKVLFAAIERLPEEQRIVVNYRLDGISFREIASLLGVSINTALGRYRYAVNNLRKYIKGEA